MSKQREVQEYNPQGTAQATHDIRVKKNEAGELEKLQPLQEQLKNKKEPTVTIPISKYNQIKHLEQIQLLGINLEKSKIPNEKKSAITKAIKTFNHEKFEKDNEIKIKKEVEALKTKLQKEAEKTAEKKYQKKNKKNKTKIFVAAIISGIIFLIFGVTGGTVYTKLTNKPQVAQASSTIETIPEKMEQALQWAISNTEHNLIWITNTPRDRRISEKIREMKNQKPHVKIILIGTQEAKVETTNVARQLNILGFALKIGLGNINWLVIDKKLLIDNTSPRAVNLHMDPIKAEHIFAWADETLGPNGEAIHTP